MTEPNRPVVLTVGGLDPTGGAGILLDAAVCRRVDVHPAAVAAVLTAQDGTHPIASFPVGPESFAAALDAVLGGLPVKVVKTGALGNAGLVELLVSRLKAHPELSVVVDPVIAASAGGRLLDDLGVETLRALLVGRATLLTPNLDEAARLTGFPVNDEKDMVEAALALVDQGAAAVLVKGGHLAGDAAVDLLATRDGRIARLASPRLPVGKVRGTGCALASLIAGLLARGLPLTIAIEGARESLGRALAASRSLVPGGSPRLLDLTKILA